MSVAIIGVGDGSETFLAGSVPYLQSDGGVSTCGYCFILWSKRFVWSWSIAGEVDNVLQWTLDSSRFLVVGSDRFMTGS